MSSFFNYKKYKNFKNKYIQDDIGKYSYAELVKETSRLKQLKLSKGLVLNITNNSFDYLLGYIFFIENKFPQILLDNDINEENLIKIIKRYEPEYIYLPIGFKIKLNKTYKVYANKTYFLFWKKVKKTQINKNLCLLLPTSGSTGEQKFAKISYQNLKNNTKNISKYLKINSKDTTITTLQPSYSYGMSILNTHIDNAASIILTNFTIVQKKFWDIYNSNQITNFNGVPITYEILEKLGLEILNNKYLRFLTSAGGSINLDLMKKIINYSEKRKINYYHMYGQTEASPRIAYVKYPREKKYLGSIGRSIPEGKMYILSNEIIYEGKNIFGGYSEFKKDLKFFKFIKKLNTGDLGYKNSAGYFFLIGRKKRIIKIFGYRYNLDDIENILKKNKISCKIIGRNDKLYIFSRNSLNEKKLHHLLYKEMKFPKDKVIIKKIKKIPLTKNGKVSYVKLESYV